MPFALLDDKFHSNPKVRALGLDGVGLYALALSYCGSYTTNGFVPREWALGAAGGRWGLLKRLVDHGAWEEVDEKDAAELADRSGNVIHFVAREKGFIIPDFLQFNPSTVELEEKHSRRVSAGRKGAIKRWSGSTSHSGSDGPSYGETDSKRHSKTMAPRARAGAHPVPDPDPEPQGSLPSSSTTTAPATPDDDHDQQPVPAWGRAEPERARAWLEHARQRDDVTNPTGYARTAYEAGGWPSEPHDTPKRIDPQLAIARWIAGHSWDELYTETMALEDWRSLLKISATEPLPLTDDETRRLLEAFHTEHARRYPARAEPEGAAA